MTNIINKSYISILSSLKTRIRSAQIKASISVNTQMIELYWEIGRVISMEQKRHKWGSKVVQRLSADLQAEFPGMKGLSYRNLDYMKNFYEKYQGFIILPQPVAKLPWSHNRVLLDKIENHMERLWYAEQAIENGWSRSVLVHQIESELYQRQAISTKVTAEYALKDISKPMGISEYKITRAIPKELKGSLPSIEEIEKEFDEKKSAE
jgi:predicted nuclease of restriction endonuclease-like (RecB) superfamily